LAANIESNYAQSVRPDAGGARMDISGYAFEGRYLLDAADFTRIVAPLIGRQKTAADIERARSALQRAYHDLGYCEVVITLADPALVNGVVRFRSTELPPDAVGNCLPKTVQLAEQPAPVALAQAEPAKPAAAPAERAASPAPRVGRRGFEVTGNTLLPAAALEDALAPHAGPDREFSDIQRALEALEQAYRDLGYGVVRVQLPEQDISHRGQHAFR
jgi:hemolysin activation/secretion protein